MSELEIGAVDRLPRLQPQIGGQHFARLLIDGAADAAREEADRRQRRHGDEERQQQHAQLAGLAVADERKKSESQRLHERLPQTIRPASMRMMRLQRCAIA